MDPTKLGYREVFGLNNLQHITSSLSGQPVPKAIVVALLAVSDWFFHPHEEMVSIVLVLILFDTITGFLKAYKADTVSSSGFFRFALKIMVYWILMATSGLLDKIADSSIPIKALPVVAAFLAITEAISIFENVAALGYPIPSWLMDLIKVAKSKEPIKSQKDKK